jgi:hypothetical protein
MNSVLCCYISTHTHTHTSLGDVEQKIIIEKVEGRIYYTKLLLMWLCVQSVIEAHCHGNSISAELCGCSCRGVCVCVWLCTQSKRIITHTHTHTALRVDNDEYKKYITEQISSTQMYLCVCECEHICCFLFTWLIMIYGHLRCDDENTHACSPLWPTI